jgi:hypothetical protein
LLQCLHRKMKYQASTASQLRWVVRTGARRPPIPDNARTAINSTA